MFFWVVFFLFPGQAGRQAGRQSDRQAGDRAITRQRQEEALGSIKKKKKMYVSGGRSRITRARRFLQLPFYVPVAKTEAPLYRA